MKDLDLLRDIQAHIFQDAVPAFSAGYFYDLEMSFYFFIPLLTYLSFRGSDFSHKSMGILKQKASRSWMKLQCIVTLRFHTNTDMLK